MDSIWNFKVSEQRMYHHGLNFRRSLFDSNLPQPGNQKKSGIWRYAVTCSPVYTAKCYTDAKKLIITRKLSPPFNPCRMDIDLHVIHNDWCRPRRAWSKLEYDSEIRKSRKWKGIRITQFEIGFYHWKEKTILSNNGCRLLILTDVFFLSFLILHLF